MLASSLAAEEPTFPKSGITQMGFEMAQRLGLCTVGRATHKRFLCYTAPQVLLWQPELAQTTVKRAPT